MTEEEAESLREQRLETQDLTSKKFDLNLVLSGIPAYLFERVPNSNAFDLINPRKSFAKQIIFDWTIRESSFLKRRRITQRAALKEGYLRTRRE